MSDAYRAGKYHAETDQPSNLAFYPRFTFAYHDYLEGQSAGFNEQYWYHVKCSKNAAKAARYLAERERVKQMQADARR